MLLKMKKSQNNPEQYEVWEGTDLLVPNMDFLTASTLVKDGAVAALIAERFANGDTTVTVTTDEVGRLFMLLIEENYLIPAARRNEDVCNKVS